MKTSKKEWIARWITTDFATVNEEPEFTLEEMFSGKLRPQTPVEERLNPVVFFKRVFDVTESASAKLMITCQGIYQATINGKPVTEAVLTPDYTNYQEWLMYQTYDVSALLSPGVNTLCVAVADGWYAGRVSVQGGSAQFGDQLALLAELEWTDASGSTHLVGTDEQFTAGTGKYRYADIQIGEKQDLREDSSWKSDDLPLDYPVQVCDLDYRRLTPQEGPLVYRQQTLEAVALWREGEAYVIDFGQVIAGRMRMSTFLKEGQVMSWEHAEALNEDGMFFKNIIGRNKDATDVFVGRGQEEILEPDFTFHGFRYVKVTGLSTLERSQVKAIVLYSEMKQTGKLTTSDAQVNQLLSNILWSQRGNMLSIPTDCPQRERVGWTGDMQVFAPASTFYMDTKDFIKRWLKAVRIDQRSNGEIVDYSPAPKDAAKSVEFTGSYSSAGWGDAIVMVPWTLYERYGDETVLQENYDAMVKWFTFAKESAASDKVGSARYLWDTKFHYGDWMLPSLMMSSPNPMQTAAVTKDIVATSFLAHTSELIGNIATILGKDASPYERYAKQVKAAFTEHYVTEQGRLTSDYQGCYVLTLAFEMVPQTMRKPLLEHLVRLIHENGDCLDTGFVSVPYLLEVLCEGGETELAKKVFLQEKCPSWMYEVQHGATTIWESWAGVQPDGHVGAFSFNHYAFGCVLDWFVRQVVGLQVVEPGYRAIKICPSVSVVSSLEMTFESASGLISIRKEGDCWSVSTPVEMKVTLDLSLVNGTLV